MFDPIALPFGSVSNPRDGTILRWQLADLGRTLPMKISSDRYQSKGAVRMGSRRFSPERALQTGTGHTTFRFACSMVVVAYSGFGR